MRRLGAARDAIVGGIRRGGEAVADVWFGLSLAVRQRIAAAAALVAIVAFALLVVVPLAPCWVPGGERCPPPDEAIDHVPGDVAAYVHANLDADTDQYESASELLGRLPQLGGAGGDLLAELSGLRVDYDAQIRPWSAGELALVVDARGAELTRMLMIEVADAEAATRFYRRLLGPGSAGSELDGTTIESDRSGFSAAISDGFLLLGPEQQVRDAVALEPGDSLAVDPLAEEALESLPERTLAEVWAAPELLTTLSGDEQLGAFDTFVNSSAAEGAAVGVAFDAEDGGVDLAVRSLQDPERAEADPDFFSALPLFEPELTDQVGADALVYLGVGEPGGSAAALVGQAASTAPDLFSGLRRFNRRLRRQGGTDIERELLPLLGGEAALTVEPQRPVEEGGDDEFDPLAGAGVPYLALLATDVDTERALSDLAELQVPIAEAIDPAAGQAPVFDSREIDGITAQSLRLSPVVDLTYAAFDDELIVGTSPAAVERARGDGERLAASDRYETVTERFPDQVSMLLYLDFRDLLVLGERLFLAEDPSYAQFAGDLRAIEAAAAAVTRTRGQLATDVRVTIGQPRTPEVGDPTPGIGPG